VNSFDVIIAGTGAAGSAAAYHLARRGVRVLALDRSSIPNDDASHAGVTRIIRRAYFEHPDYVPLLNRAYELWRDLERTQSSRFFFTPGALYAGPVGCELLAGVVRSAGLHSIPIEHVSRANAAERFPGFVIPEDHGAILEPDAGFLLAHDAIRAHAQGAAQAGATLRAHEAVLRWGDDGSGVWVETVQGRYTGARLILAAGAWMPGLSRMRLPLSVTRQTLVWVTPEPGVYEGAPVWAFMHHDGTMYYGFPAEAGGDAGLKAARHFKGDVIDPDTGDRAAPEREVAEVVEFLRERLPRAGARVRRACTCLYTSTPDEHFVIGVHPEHARVIVASPCSGHGFKFASVVGEALADLAHAGRTDLPIGFLSPARFHGAQRERVP